MTDPTVWLVAGYALFLLAAGWAIDLLSRKSAKRTAQWRTGGFIYHEDHDAWVCPEDHWLWPSSFDPQHRVMRYRGLPTVCNSCPVKSSCTASDHGREVSREVDPWPHSEAGRFHRGMACVVAGFALVLLVGAMIGNHSPSDLLVLGSTTAVVVLAFLPLARHLWNSPSNAPAHLPHRTGEEDAVAAAIEKYGARYGAKYGAKYATRWGGWSDRADKVDRADTKGLHQ